MAITLEFKHFNLFIIQAVQLFSARYNEVLDVEVNCGGCGTTLPGGRYRCLQCASIDVCASCYADGIVPADGHCVDHDLMHFLYEQFFIFTLFLYKV